MKIKKIFNSFMIALMAIVLSTVAYAQENENELLTEVLSLSGVDQEIKAVPAQVKFGFEQTSDQVPEPVYAKILEAIDNAYDSNKIYNNVFSEINLKFDKQKFLDIKEKFKMPLIQKLTQLEVESSDVKNHNDLLQFANNLQTNPAQESRIAIIDRLDQALDASDMTTKIALLSQRVVMRAVNSALPEEKKLPEEKLVEFENNFSTKASEPIKQSVALTLQFAYRDVTDEELNQYLEVLESENGQWFNETLNVAFLNAMTDATDKFGEMFSTLFKEAALETQQNAAAQQNQSIEQTPTAETIQETVQ